MKNSMLDTHNHLMARLEELNQEGLTSEQLDNVVKRAETSVKVAGVMIDNGRLILDAQRLVAEHGVSIDQSSMPMLTARKPV